MIQAKASVIKRATSSPLRRRKSKARAPVGGGALIRTEVAILLDQRNLLFFLGGYILRQRRISEPGCVILPVFQHPTQEAGDRLFLCRIVYLRWYQQVSEGGDGVGLLARLIGDGNPEVGGHALGGGSRGLGDAFQVRLQERPGGIAQVAVRHFLLQRVDQLYIADRVGSLLYYSGDAFVALAAYSNWPLYRSTRSHLGFPFGADFGKVIGEHEAGAAAVGPVGDHNIGIRQLHAGVGLGQLGIVPLLDLAQVDSR